MMKIGVIGSCRVHTPLKMEHSAGRLIMRIDNIIGFIHNTKETIQKLEILSGNRPVSAEYHDMLNFVNRKADLNRDNMKIFFGEVDVMVVEISSLRIVYGGGFYVQINRFREKLSRLPDGPALSANLFKNPQDSGALVTEYLKSHQIDDDLAKILQTLEFREQDPSEIYQDTLEILGTLKKPTLIVSHFTQGAASDPIPQRVVLKSALQKAVSDTPSVRLYDPTDQVMKFPTPALKDMSHYTPDFERHLATVYQHEITQLLQQR